MTLKAGMHNWLYPDWPAPSHIHAVTTTRTGGVSQGTFDSMNLANHVEDHVDAVQSNRARLKEMLCLPNEPFWLNQVHGTNVVDISQVNANNRVDSKIDSKADGSYSTQADAVCAVLTADCLPVLLCNREGTRIAAVHAGWRGLLAGVIEAALSKFGLPGSEILAWLGPAIGPTAFEVGEEVREQFIQQCPQAVEAFKQVSTDRLLKDHVPQSRLLQGCLSQSPLSESRLPESLLSESKWLADVYQLARLRLALKGVTRVYGGGWCTLTDRERFYSYRRDGVTGRMASLIWMEA